MGNKLYVGNLAYSVRDDSLQAAFSQFGTVTSAKVMMDRETGRSKGFGFVEMGSDAEAQAAINGMNGQALEGRPLVVNEARPREQRSGGEGDRKVPSPHRLHHRGHEARRDHHQQVGGLESRLDAL